MGGGANLDSSDSPSQIYFSACEKSGVAPLPIPFVTGHSRKLNVSGKALEDRSLLPITKLTSELERLEEIDLSGNALLTDKSLVPLFATFLGRRIMPVSVVRLSLSRCQGAGQGTLKTITVLLGQARTGLGNL